MSDLDFIDNGVSEIADSMGFESDNDKRDEDTTELDNEILLDEETSEREPDEATDEAHDEPMDSEPVAKEQPKSWAKDKAELWAKTPDDVREYIEQRESQMLEGINQYRDGYRYGERLAQVIEPYRLDIEAAGGDEASAIMNLFEHHRAITTGTLDQRRENYIKIGIASGLIPQEGQQIDPKVSQLEQRISAFERQQRQQETYAEQRARQSAQSMVDDFAKTHEHFDLLQDEIAQLLPSAGNDLQKAYDKALWLNDVTRQKEIDRVSAEKAKARQAEAEKAKKAASVNIRSAQSKARPTESKGRLFDESDMSNTLREIRSKA